jgi:chorismate mutase
MEEQMPAPGPSTPQRIDAAGVTATAPAPTGATLLASTEKARDLYVLVDAAAERLQTAHAVAAWKWVTGGAVEDGDREKQVLDAVTAAAEDRAVDPGFVAQVFRDQIDATVAVEYALFSNWKLHTTPPPRGAPTLSDSRGDLDRLNRTIVEELAAQFVALHTPGCPAILERVRAAVVRDRDLDALFERGLRYATRSYCR